MITIDDLKEKFSELGYFITNELLYDAFNAIYMFDDSGINAGQDIFAICLEGPPGAGKTAFAETYANVCSNIFSSDVVMVEYQCDATTGKTELFEDINISAAISGDAENVNVPGKLVTAIKEVNKGKKVILFIDEYDKAREETDAFLLQFLQSGKINATQYGDLEIKEEYKSNLQVILCKNDMREELSGPLSRRIRITRLEYMMPSIFYQVADYNLIEKRKNSNKKVDSGILNLVSLMYKAAYENVDIFDRLPSCSEMLIAIEDADRLLKYANAPKDIVYNSIVRNMFKNIDDMATFETCLNNDSANRDLRRIINNMKKGGSFTKVEDLNSLISKKMFKDAYKKYHKKAKEFEELTYTLEKNYEKALEDKKKELESEMIKNNQNYKEVNERINLENGKLISTNKVPNIRSNFLIEDDYIRRGQDIFELSENDWICIGSFKITNDAHYDFIEKVISADSLLDVKIYENGILLNDIENQKTIIVNDISNENDPVYKIMSNEFVIPSIVLEKIYAFMYFTSNIYKDNTSFNINTLIYNDKPLNLIVQSDNVYSLSLDGDFSELDKISGMFKNFECSDFNKVVEKSNEIREQVKSKKYS